MIKPPVSFEQFQSLDIRVGRVVKVEEAATKKPTYRMTVDFGASIGTKVSCGAYRNYSPEQLIGKQVIAVVNFPAKRMGPEISEVLILGVQNDQGETVYLKPESDMPNGGQIF